MTREENLQWLAICVAAADRGVPMTDEEKASHRRLVCDEYRRAEARRNEPTPQLDLAA